MGLFGIKASKKPVGLDIGSKHIRVVEMGRSHGRPAISRYGMIDIPPGVMVEGEITDVNAMAELLKELWKKAKISQSEVHLGVANQKVIARLIEFPLMTRDELEGAIEFQAQEFIPIPLEEAVLDFEILGEVTTEEGERKVEILLVAAQKDMVYRHVEALEKAGLKPIAVDLSSLAIARANLYGGQASPESESQPQAITAFINIESGLTNIVIAENDKVRFTRVSGLAGDDFSQKVADLLVIPLSQAKKLKAEIGLSPNPDEKLGDVLPEYVDDMDRVKLVREILIQEAERFVNEIKRSFNFYLTQTGGKVVNRVVLTGGGSVFRNLDLFMSQALGITTVFGKFLDRFAVRDPRLKQDVEKDEPSLAVSIGLALREFE
ncbi:MAG: type IV pilus assembly protein PilM [Actinomycetota bacterium]|nr:type IV pilus assembly protein PilM [Actinomycetota bacterium]